jgi:hypothetical protein
MIKRLLLLLVFIITIFTGCSIKKDLTLNIEADFVQSNSTNKSYTLTQNVSAKDASSDFDKYSGDLDGVELTSSTYLVSYFSGDATQTVSATVKISDQSGNQMTDLATITNINLLTVAAKDQNLTVSNEGINTFVNLMKNSPNNATLYFNGSTNEVPFTATIKLKFAFKVTYKKGFPYF